MEELATKSGYDLDFLPALKQVRVLAFDKTSEGSSEMIRTAKEQLQVLLAGRNLDNILESIDMDWPTHINKYAWYG